MDWRAGSNHTPSPSTKEHKEAKPAQSALKGGTEKDISWHEPTHHGNYTVLPNF